MDLPDSKEVGTFAVEWIRMMAAASDSKFTVAGVVMIVIVAIICFAWYRVKILSIESQSNANEGIPLAAFTAMMNEHLVNVRDLTATIAAQVEMAQTQSHETAKLTVQIAAIVDHVKDVKEEMTKHKFCPLQTDTCSL